VLENELKAHPGNRPAAIVLGMTWFRLGNYVRASEVLSGVIDRQVAGVDIYYALASSLIKQGKADAADRIIEKIKTIAGDAPQVHLLLAEKYSASGVAAKPSQSSTRSGLRIAACLWSITMPAYSI